MDNASAAEASALEVAQLQARIAELESLVAAQAQALHLAAQRERASRDSAAIEAAPEAPGVGRQEWGAAPYASDRQPHLLVVSAALAGRLTIDAALAAILEHAVAAAGARAGAVFQAEPHAGTLRLLAANGFSADHVARLRALTPAAATVFTDALRTGASVYVSSPAERDVRYPQIHTLRQSSDSAAAGLPLSVDGQVIGCIGLTFAEPQHFTLEARTFLEAIAQQCAVALHRALLYTTLQTVSQEMREALTLLDTLFANAPVGLAFVDRDLRFVRINEALAEINGQSVRSHVNRHLRDVLPHLAEQLEPLYQSVLSSGKPLLSLEISGETQAAPGHERHWLVSYYPVADPDAPPIGVGVVVVEISAIRRAEQALRSSESNLRALFDSSSQAIILIDTELRIVQWNQHADSGMFRHFGKHLVAGALITAYMLPETIPERLALLQRALRGERIETKLSVSTPTAPLWLAVHCSPIRTADGVICGVCLSTLDITTEKAAEEALHAYAHQMQALSMRLVQAQEAERRALAHELHDEIGQQLTGLNMVLEASTAETPDQIRARLRSAQQVVIELTGQVRQLSLDLRPSMLDDLGLLPTLQWFVRRYSEQTRIAVDFKHHGLKDQISPHVAIVVYRLVQEGLTNVARHAQASAAMVQVWLSQGQLAIVIEDEGCGFDATSALHAQRSVGLAGMRERVALLGGQLSIDSAPGEGTRLFVTLPLDNVPGTSDDEGATR
ncbi:MAG: hypothetical protein RLZZ387_3331 [Chloroflexota bacterium]